MWIISWIIIGISSLAVIGTAASLLQFDDWWIRAWDFPRVQIVILLLIGLVGLPFVFNPQVWWHYALTLALIASLVFQLAKIWPYTPMASNQVKQAVHLHEGGQLSILMSNVLQPNRNAPALLDIIREKDPDIILTLETNHWWQEQLSELEKDYPYCVKVPLENLYGMHLYSRLPLVDPEVKYLIEEDIPSIHTLVELRCGRVVDLHCVHPTPPSPTESYASTHRDAELLLVGKAVQHNTLPTIVCGDLNDVAWSYTTTLFQKVSGLLDPRKGRGFFNTFHAKYRLARWPLDHIFHSNDFTLIHIERLPYYGSDHFPVFVQLNLEKEAKPVQPKPTPEPEEEEQAVEKIKNGILEKPNTVVEVEDNGRKK